jgi:hypothetical protein
MVGSVPSKTSRDILGKGNRSDIDIPQKIISESIIHLSPASHDHKEIPVESQIFVLDEIELLQNDQKSKDHEYGNGKLNYYQDLPEGSALFGRP